LGNGCDQRTTVVGKAGPPVMSEFTFR
jgi:hypothetical protein